MYLGMPTVGFSGCFERIEREVDKNKAEVLDKVRDTLGTDMEERFKHAEHVKRSKDNL